MILQRAAKAIRTQDWFTVFIEFILVVFGVLVALQVDEWQEREREKRLEQGYLERLREDFQTSLGATRGLLGFQNGQVAWLTTAIKSLETCEVKEEDRGAFASALLHMGKINLPPLVRRTVSELEGAGGFRLLESDTVKRGIDAVVQENSQASQVQQSLLTRITPAVNRLNQYFRFDYPKADTTFDDLATWDDLVFDLETMCKTPSVINDLSYIRINTFNMNRFFARHQTAYTRAIAALDDELNTRFPQPAGN